MTYRERRRQVILWTISQWMRRHGAWCVLVLSFSVVTAGTALAKEASPVLDADKTVDSEKKKDEKTVEKTVKGTVSFIRKSKMAVEYAATEKGGEEIFLTIDKDVTVKNVKKFSDIARGDTVQVRYVETYRDPKEKGGERFVLSMVVKEISFVSKPKTGLSS